MSNLKMPYNIITSIRSIPMIRLIFILVMLPLFTPVVMAQCGNQGHSTNEKDSWLSCQTSVMPNNLAPLDYHWIYYDLGYSYPLEMITIWNYNVENETENGIKDGEIFYSEDGQNWISGGTFQIPEADGRLDYEGWEGIDLSGVSARFITLTAYSNWGNGNCTGFSEIRFNIGEQITSINQRATTNSEMLVFPNPTNQVLSISLKNNQQIKELIIVDNAGHEFLRKRQPVTNLTLDVASFPTGMYYIKAWTSNQTYLVNKFVKTDL